ERHQAAIVDADAPAAIVDDLAEAGDAGPAAAAARLEVEEAPVGEEAGALHGELAQERLRHRRHRQAQRVQEPGGGPGARRAARLAHPVESELEAAEAGPRPGLDVRFGARGARQQEQRPRDGPHPIMMAYFALPAPSATLGCAPCLFWQRTRKPI